MKKKDPQITQPPTLFYDGDCGLCHRVIRIIQKVDRKKHIRYVSLQSEEAKRFKESLTPDMAEADTIYLSIDKRRYMKARAVMHVCGYVGGWYWAVYGVLYITPSALRDKLYDIIASNRYRIFGENIHSCPLPSKTKKPTSSNDVDDAG